MVQYPLVRNLKTALIWLTAFAALLFITFSIPSFFFLVCFVSPVLLAICGLKAGLVPLAACAMLLPAASWLHFGGTLAPLLCVLYLWPFLAVHVFCFSRKVPFWQAVAAHVALLAVSQTAILLILRPYLGGNLFSGGAEFLVNQISASPFGDQILLQLYQSRLLTVPEEMHTGLRALAEKIWSSFTFSVLTPSERTELLNGLRTLLENSLYTFLPATVINNAILSGVFGVAFPIKYARAKGISIPEMAPFASWHLSRSTGFKVLLLGLGTLLPTLFRNTGMLIAGNMMWAAFSTIFVIQGAALLDFFQTRGGNRPFMRRLWPCLLYFLIPTLLMILGIADQILNIRGLRTPKNREES